MPPPSADRSRRLWPAADVLGFFVAVGAALWVLDGQPAQLAFFSAIGVATGAGFLVHARARPRRKVAGRKLSLALVGLSLFASATTTASPGSAPTAWRGSSAAAGSTTRWGSPSPPR